MKAPALGALLAVPLLAACGTNGEDAFLKDFQNEYGLSMAAGGDVPSEAEAVRLAHVFCDAREAAPDEWSGDTAQTLMQSLSEDEAHGMRLVWHIAEDTICPEE